MFRVVILAVLATVAVCTGTAVAADGPMADAGLDQTVTVETTVQLDGTGSGHPDGPITAYEWTIYTPDGREIEPDCADCERPQFTPSSVGRYEVNLTVTGPDGTQSTDTLYVYVEDGGPDVELTGDQTPDPNQAVTYTASAESPDAELEEIAWAVEDEIVTVRSLDGSTDESELSLAFSETETHRVQVVVRDTNGRTAYDQLLVQPQSGSTSVSSWDEVEPTGCEDSTYAARNAEECWDLDEPEASDDDEQPAPETFEVRYDTLGYSALPPASTVGEDSSFVASVQERVGLDDGDSAPWRQSTFERMYGATIGEGTRFLFGQEERTVTCEISGDEQPATGCAQQVYELEQTGQTMNEYSPSETGAYSEYGLEGGERISGVDPTDLDEGERAEVTIVIQQEEDGIVDRAVEGAKETVNDVFSSGDNGDDSSGASPVSSSSSRTSTSSNSASSGLLGGMNGVRSGTGNRGSSGMESSDGDTSGSTDTNTGHTTRNDRGLVA